MANVFIEDSTLTAIGDAIRSKTGSTDLMLPGDMPSAIDSIASSDTAYNDGYEAGQQSAYDRFWDVYQQNGKRTDYRGCFGGAGWTWELFRPKYDLKPAWGAGSDMFRGTQLSGSLKQHLSNIGITLDCSEMINATSMFYSTTTITETPDFNFSKCTSLNMTFYGCTALESCKIIVSATCTNYNNAFANCTALTNLTIEGEIAATLDLKSCPLSRASILSVYNALSTTQTGQTLSLNKAAVEAAFTAEEWNAMKAEKPNWSYGLS